MSSQIFTKTFIESLPDIKPFENPWVIALAKMPERAKHRKMLDQWFANFPDDAKEKMLVKLQSRDDEIFIPALYELAMHQYCLEEGWSVEYEPPLDDGLTPDFVITTNTGYKFILEVTTLFRTKEETAIELMKRDLQARIAMIKTGHVLDITFNSPPDKNAKPGSFTKKVSKWLASIEADGNIHRKVFVDDGVNINILVDPKLPKPTHGCVFSVMDSGGQVPNYSKRIKSALDDKRRKYNSNKTGLPLVIAYCDGIGRVAGDSSAIDKALFGELTVSFGGNQPSSVGRDRSGHFTPRNNATGEWFGKNTGISGVLYCSLREVSQYNMQLFHNPVAVMPIQFETFLKIPQLIVTEKEPNLQMRWAIGNRATFTDNPEELGIKFE